MPKHIAIIMDGNGRWAKKRGLPRSAGHKAGAEAIRDIVRECSRLGVQSLTVYMFSTENWNRPADEVQTLMTLIERYLHTEADELDQNNVRLTALGDMERLPESLRAAMRETTGRLEKNTGLRFNLAINYGGRAELVHAAQTLAKRALDGGVPPESLTEADFGAALYTDGQPDVDLLIRTSGEMRLSGFLPYQSTYAELVFCDTLWPDYDVKALHRDIAAYQARNRRFGKV